MYSPISPQQLQSYIDGSKSKPSVNRFPPNLAANVPLDVQKKMWQWLLTKYIWPQIQERMPFEPLWDKILKMARIEMKYEDLFQNSNLDVQPAKQSADQSNRDSAQVADSVVADAIQRSTDLTCFIAWKEGLPAQFAMPEYMRQPYAVGTEYNPLKDRIDAANCLLKWNTDNQDVKRKSRIVYRHHYTYGIAFVLSDFEFEIQMRRVQNNTGQYVDIPEITKLGTTFEPISIRKLWLNWRLPAYDMDNQPCPFFFTETPRFATLQNVYHPILNPFGFQNLEMIGRGDLIYTGPEMESVRTALQDRLNAGQPIGGINQSVSQILEPEYSVEAKWTLFPVMPFDPDTNEFEFRADGTTPVPMKRFVMETWGTNVTGKQVIIRLQDYYYPKGKSCIYASAHMPDLDSGTYSPSYGQLLENHYREIVLCKEQFSENKNLVNSPPWWVQISSPANAHQNPNRPGTKVEVNGPNDLGWREVFDATASTTAWMEHLRDQAQTTSKSVDALMGKAMGARTTATEAGNAFETSMSAVTTDIDMLSYDIHRPYAERVWDYFPLWLDPDLIFLITGQLGFQMRPEDFWLSISCATNVGSTYVEKITRQQNTRYVLEASKLEPNLNRPKLWTMLLDDMGLPGADIVDDGGRDSQIQFATLQAVQTYMGQMVLVDPDQDHTLAIRVKTAFIKDRTSVWNTDPDYARNAPALISQIQQHQFFLQLQMQMMLAQQQMAASSAQLGIHQENPPNPSSSEPGRRNVGGGGKQTAGQVAQQGGGAA